MYILKTISMDKIWGDERLKAYGRIRALFILVQLLKESIVQ